LSALLKEDIYCTSGISLPAELADFSTFVIWWTSQWGQLDWG